MKAIRDFLGDPYAIAGCLIIAFALAVSISIVFIMVLGAVELWHRIIP